MSEDASRIRADLLAVFFEDAEENLGTLETGLLRLESEGSDAELVNEIFRGAHSLKGAAGSFGFAQICSVAHVMETLLDEVRAGDRNPDASLVADLLGGVDCLRAMLEQIQDGGESDDEAVTAVLARLEGALGAPIRAGASTELEATDGPRRWMISFRPHENLMHSGNDPVRILEELARLGSVQTRLHAERLPALEELNPENFHLGWTIDFEGNVTREQLDEVFVWVADDCDLKIATVQEASQEVLGEASAPDQPRSGASTSGGSGGRSAKATPSIRVGLDKIDLLMNMVGELVITQSMLGELNTQEGVNRARLEQLSEGLAQLSRNTRDLQESVMRIRSMPISLAFNRFPRLVHDLSHQFKKKVELRITGESTELDKTVLEKLGDPLVHLVRNSLDHGLELPAERAAQGKPETGTLQLNAYHQGSSVVVEVRDDGAGLNRPKILARARERGIVRENESMSDEEIDNLIFRPGFSTADAVSDVSGRGVGMDVVRRNIQALGGKIEVQSNPGQGTCVTVRLPLTLAIVEGQLVRLGSQIYILPLTSIVESLQVEPGFLTKIGGQHTYRLREQLIPIIDLSAILGIELDNRVLENGLLVVVEGDGRSVGFLVDELLAQQQVVIKSLETNYHRVDGLAGATILGDGSVSFILDTAGLVALARHHGGPDSGPVWAAA